MIVSIGPMHSPSICGVASLSPAKTKIISTYMRNPYEPAFGSAFFSRKPSSVKMIPKSSAITAMLIPVTFAARLASQADNISFARMRAVVEYFAGTSGKIRYFSTSLVAMLPTAVSTFSFLFTWTSPLRYFASRRRPSSLRQTAVSG